MPGSPPTAPAVTHDDVQAAFARIDGQVRRTPAVYLAEGDLGRPHPPFWLKLESLQVTGAFKARGALNNLLASGLPAAGVCAASGGNHGQAVAWAARRFGAPCTVFVPVTCPPVKLERLHSYGASVTVAGDVYDESLLSAQSFADRTGALMVHPFDQPLTVAGAGTVTSEFVAQTPELDTLLVPVGGGGLLAGALAVLDGTGTRVVAVEPTSARCLGAALDAGEPVDVCVSGPAVDSLGPRRVGLIGLHTAQRHSVRHAEVSDTAIVEAQQLVWQELRIGLEGGGATALSALLSCAYMPADGEVVGVLACGGNVPLPALG